jgi:THO complex subunit 4
MNEKIDLSLDEIIAKEGITANYPKRGSGVKSRGRSFGSRFGGRNRQSSRSQPYFRSQNNNKSFHSSLSGRLMISNLAYSVTDDDLNELFASFGPLKKSSIHYDQFGYSLGTAEIVFEMKEDAINAHNKYNGVPLDGKQSLTVFQLSIY